MNENVVDQTSWFARATLYELLAKSLIVPTAEFADALRGGEYGEALGEVALACGLEERVVAEACAAIDGAVFSARNGETFFHKLRRAYTKLFIGGSRPLASPFAGVWWARRKGVPPLLFVNEESLAVEAAMKSCGVGHSQGSNHPLDHIGTELEFLEYLCAAAASTEDTAQSAGHLTASRAQDAYGSFYNDHFRWFADDLAAQMLEADVHPFYRAVALVLGGLPKTA